MYIRIESEIRKRIKLEFDTDVQTGAGVEICLTTSIP